MPSPRATLSGARRTIAVSAVATVAGALLTTVLTTPAGATSPTGARATASPAAAEPDSGERRIVRYRVRPGDTATELAVRFHAWTDELISLNRLGPSARLQVGEQIRIPVVVDRAGDRRTTTKQQPATKPRTRQQERTERHRGNRRIVRYRVRPGDTASDLAVRFHAWTDELVSLNHLGPSARLQAGEQIRIPVVVDRAGDDRAGKKKQRATRQKAQKQRTKKQEATRQKARNQKARKRKPRAQKCNDCRSAQPARQHVRRVITRTSRRHGVDPELALAISWQESGWRMGPVSYVGAVGAMQVMPTTGVWMSMYAGRSLDINDVHDNAEAGVRMLKVLRGMTDGRRELIGAYYQGPTAVRKYGLYRETETYVDNVLAIKRTLERGRPPG